MTGKYWEQPLETLDHEQWESLCDNCGKCCVHKVEDELSGEFHATNVTCRLLDRQSCRCSNYKARKALVPDCITLTRNKIAKLGWLPSTCAYRLRAEGKPLPDWHYLVCGDREEVHRRGMSVRGWTVSEDDAGDLEHHLIEREL